MSDVIALSKLLAVAESDATPRHLPSPLDRRGIREAAGVTLEGLAAAVGISGATMHRWERGSTKPSSADAVRRYRRAVDAMQDALAEKDPASLEAVLDSVDAA